MSVLSKTDWVHAAFAVFGEGGIAAVKIEPISKNLGVSKGSFYWHFQNRQALFDAMLDEWEFAGTKSIIDHVNQVSDDPVERLKTLGHITFRPSDFDRIEANLRIWATTYPPAAKRCEAIDTMRIEYVEGLLREIGMSQKVAHHRADLMYLALIGNSTRLNAGGKSMTTEELEELLSMLLGHFGET